MRDVVINLLASAIAAAVAWTAQYLVRYSRISRRRSFFGIRPGVEVLLFVAKHFSSPRPESVHRNDVATLVELATTIRSAGGLPSLVGTDEARREAGRVTEYCVGGPSTNPRTAAHLRAALPGVRFESAQETDHQLAFWVGDRVFRREPGVEQFALLARVRQSTSASPAFVLAGQTALDNLAAARYLSANYRSLRRRYGQRKDFCLVLGLKEPAAFGAGHVDLVADVSAQAQAQAPAGPALPQPRPAPAAVPVGQPDDAAPAGP